MHSKKNIGDFYEKEARRYLETQKLTFIAQNQRYKVGELDLVMKDNTCIVFIEVKFRQHRHFGGAASSISKTKQTRLIRAAFSWLKQHRYSTSHTQFRFDAVIFEGNVSTVSWLKNIVIEG